MTTDTWAVFIVACSILIVLIMLARGPR